ncbi:recombinase family protein [Bacillus sp. B1-b2]|uniref:recombinase family protein n=1 Tax=Bacillus sp. B1-b2 TaxID=2653201 RepID=UPI000B9ABC8A|nr:recombinase family protein [Bacillus sp. B1-b2]KAB7665082.1 recombinase family protein [Bacillus sp. B1-b2]OXT17226.1 recombinase [Bacillus sp. OG2]
MQRPTQLDVYIYLRKSRKDIEEERKAIAENKTYDTLTRHRDTLMAIVKKENHNVIGIFEEVVSGESIYERPEMQKLLRLIDEVHCDAVLVMDLDRLGRGDMYDQGMLDRAFRFSGTKIITPTEIHDPEDETWELVFSIKSLIAREELKAITKRLQRGRHTSAAAGKSISKKPPYGYKRLENLKLEPDSETDWVVKKMFEMMRDGHGRQAIAAELDKLGVQPPDKESDFWSPSSITAIVKNEVYMGHIIWGKFKSAKRNGGNSRKKMPRDKWTITENAHPPIVSPELWEAANSAHTGRWRPSTVQTKTLSNPLAGILKCQVCGYTMWYQPRKNRPNHMIRCPNPKCKGVQKGAILSLVEQRIIQGLEEIIGHFEVEEGMIEKKEESSTITIKEKVKANKEKELEKLYLRQDNIHTYRETGEYTMDVFLERSQMVANLIKQTKNEISILEEEIEKAKFHEQNINQYIPTVKKVLDAYKDTDDIEKKNRLLKTVLEKVTYLREKEWTQKDQFKIELYPKI